MVLKPTTIIAYSRLSNTVGIVIHPLVMIMAIAKAGRPQATELALKANHIFLMTTV